MSKPLNIVLVEPFFGGSHRKWAMGFQKHSKHKVDILSLSAHHWKWRMRIGAVELAKQFNNRNLNPDLILVTDMLDLAQFSGLIKPSKNIKSVLYMHENQITYPWSDTDDDILHQRDHHYGFINYTSCLAADEIWFNSNYHLGSFIGALPKFLNQFPDYNQKESIDEIRQKSKVIPVGIEPISSAQVQENAVPKILWNHRWEYDKNPDQFFEVLGKMKAKKFDCELVVLGKKGSKQPAVFENSKSQFQSELTHLGYTENANEYAKIVASCDILPVTSNQDFFGISVVESILHGAIPLLPNRLAYPEHIPDHLKNEFLYDSVEELEKKLEKLLRNWPQKPATDFLIRHCKKYEWSLISESMDSQMLGMCNS